MKIEFYLEGTDKLLFSINKDSSQYQIGDKVDIAIKDGSGSDLLNCEITNIQSYTNNSYGIHVNNMEVIKITIKRN